MKKLAFLVAAAILAMSFCGCSADFGSDEGDLYDIGIEAVKNTKKLLASDEYAEINDVPDSLSAIAKGVDLSDYKHPNEVYKVTLTDAEAFYEAMLSGSVEWNELSDFLKEQLAEKMTLQAAMTQQNSIYGVETVAATALYTATAHGDGVRLDAPVTYLYCYGSEVSVIVTFSVSGSAASYLVFGDEDDLVDYAENAGFEFESLT